MHAWSKAWKHAWQIRTAASSDSLIDIQRQWRVDSSPVKIYGYPETSRSRGSKRRQQIPARLFLSHHSYPWTAAAYTSWKGRHRHGTHSVSMLPIPMPGQDVGTPSAERILLCRYSYLISFLSFLALVLAFVFRLGCVIRIFYLLCIIPSERHWFLQNYYFPNIQVPASSTARLLWSLKLSI